MSRIKLPLLVGMVAVTMAWIASPANAQVAPINLNYDAGADDGANNTWENTGTTGGFNITSMSGQTYNGSPTTSLAGITGAYDFDGSGSGGNLSTLNSLSNSTSASFEMWFRPTDLSGDEVMFETGGGNGVGIFLGGGSNGALGVVADTDVLFSVTQNSMGSQTAFVASDLSGIGTSEFIQVVGTFDVTGNGTSTLYINGTPVGSSVAAANITDWSGGDNAGVGKRGGSNMGGVAGGDQGFTNYDGEIAIFRVYESKLLSATEVGTNFNAIAGGDVYFDDDSLDGKWDTGSNWSSGIEPAPSQNAFINGGLTAAVSLAGEMAKTLAVGSSSTGGPNTPGDGTLNITGGGLTVTGDLTVGETHTGIVTASGGTTSVGGNVALGTSGGNGTLNVNATVNVGGNITEGTGTGAVTMNGGTLGLADGSTVDADLSFTLNGHSTVNVDGADTAIISSVIGDVSNKDLTKSGTGTIVLEGANTYNKTIITGGKVQVGDGATAGTLGDNNVDIGNGTTLEFNRTDNPTVSNNITLPGGSSKTISVADGASARLTGGNIGMDTGERLIFHAGTGAVGRLDSSIASGNADGLVDKTGPGTWIFTSNSNNYDGGAGTRILGGTLQIGAGGTTGKHGNTDLLINDATLALNRSDGVTFTKLIDMQADSKIHVMDGANVIDGTLDMNDTSNMTLTIQVDAGASLTIDNNPNNVGMSDTTLNLIANGTGVGLMDRMLASGNAKATVTKTGTGVWELGHTYAGDDGWTLLTTNQLDILDGTIRAQANNAIPSGHADHGNVFIDSLGKLDLNTFDMTLKGVIGTGTVQNLGGGTSTLTVGLLSPGTSPGLLTIDTGVELTFSSGGSFDVEIFGTTPGLTHDQVVFNGPTLNLAGADLNVASSGVLSLLGQEIIIIDSAVGATGNFNGLADGAMFSTVAPNSYQLQWEIHYDGGSGTDVTLTLLSVVPEPTTALIWSLLAAAGLGLRWRRRR